MLNNQLGDLEKKTFLDTSISLFLNPSPCPPPPSPPYTLLPLELLIQWVWGRPRNLHFKSSCQVIKLLLIRYISLESSLPDTSCESNLYFQMEEKEGSGEAFQSISQQLPGQRSGGWLREAGCLTKDSPPGLSCLWFPSERTLCD